MVRVQHPPYLTFGNGQITGEAALRAIGLATGFIECRFQGNLGAAGRPAAAAWLARDGSGRAWPSRIVVAISSRRRSFASSSASSRVGSVSRSPTEIRERDDKPAVFVPFDLHRIVEKCQA